MESFYLHQNRPLMDWSSKITMEETVMVENKWVKHYSSSHQILLVGEGDFSFSLSLAVGFGSATNIFATSFDSYAVSLIYHYKNARDNLSYLEAKGATLEHDVDARKMKDHPLLHWRKFDFIVYNFPHAGFHGKENNPDMIKMHQALVHGFFSNARQLLKHDGQIHVTHKTDHPYSDWNLKELAFNNGLRLIESASFDIKDYPRYENKRGDGPTRDNTFDWKESCTFKFAHEPFLFINSPYRFIVALPRVKFIVKGKVRLNPRGAGYAGVLVDENHSIRANLRGPLPNCVLDVDVAELLAIKYALLMFERSELCCREVPLVVESDSNQAVSWIKSDFGNPIELLEDLKEISRALFRIKNHVEFSCNYREYGDQNHNLVLQLAMEGISENKMYEAWVPYKV